MSIEYVYKFEKYDEAVDEVYPLLILNQKEVNIEKTLKPDLALYKNMSETGHFRALTIRIKDTCELVGYMLVLVNSSLNDAGMNVASIHAMYIRPEHRGLHIFTKCLSWLEEELKKKSINELSFTLSTMSKANKLLEFCNYKLTDVIYSKNLGA